ncbi:glycoside hydrolase family 1 protein [Agreia sp. COWG]|uniref:glycoside hydrolase family 1 protein n=1 Tax=Agreia sp. COWG TaxID=2773266 RepID=UPI001927C11C|nr:family 1 glycosylhydrolase [Agreia sp. COWG]CAD6002222.1 Glycoside hydrolase [Agreia sp. COWG]
MTSRATRFPSAASLAQDLPPSLLLGAAVGAHSIDEMSRDAGVALVREVGSDFLSFVFSWQRVQPGGTGRLAESALSAYDRLIDGLLAERISPLAILLDGESAEANDGTPEALRGGWLNRDTARRFGDLAFQLAERFGDRIDRWVTLDAPATLARRGPARGIRLPGAEAPGDPLDDLVAMGRTLLLGHGHAVEALRGAGVAGEIGLTNVHSPSEPVTSGDADTAASWLFDAVHTLAFADPVLLGRYPRVPDHFASRLVRLIEVDESELALIHQPIDFYGCRYAFPSRVAAGSSTAPLPFRLSEWPEFETTATGAPVAPDYLGVALSELDERYGEALPPVFVFAASPAFSEALVLDERTGERVIADPRRIDYLARHLEEAVTATASGSPASSLELRGYSVGDLFDEATRGAPSSRGCALVHVDGLTRELTPKDSYRWLQTLVDNRSR